jgi:hypothetical protein
MDVGDGITHLLFTAFAKEKEAICNARGEVCILADQLQQSLCIVNGRVAPHTPTDGGEGMSISMDTAEVILGACKPKFTSQKLV